MVTALNGPVTAKRCGIHGETDPGRCVATRSTTLRERLTLVAERAARGELDGVKK